MRRVLYLLGNLADHDVDWLESVGRLQVYTEGQILISQDSPLDEIFILLDGLLAVRVGKTAEFELAKLYPGEITGELSFLDSRPPSATVLAIETSRVLAIPHSDLNRKLAMDNSFAARFYRGFCIFLASRLRQRVGEMSSAAPDSSEFEDPDELDPDLLDQTSLAAARFDHLLTHFLQT